MPQYEPIATIPDSEGVDTFVESYLECAEWIGLLPLDNGACDDRETREALAAAETAEWSLESVKHAVTECADFREAAGTLLDGIEPEQAGHDFWLTRNRHGVGFWDRGLGDRGRRLTELSHTYGEAYVIFDPQTGILKLA